MSTNNSQDTNTEKFQEMLRRTSDRLRGGSVPPPDSEPVVPNAISARTTAQRGRGCGRGRRDGTSSTRTSGQPSAVDSSTPVVTLTVPGANTQPPPALPAPGDLDTGPEPPPSTLQAPTVDATAQGNGGTLVLHSGGLIARDNVVVTPSLRSPNRRATVTAVGESPPKGFQSWLLANGLTVVNDSNANSSNRQGVTSAITQSLASAVTGQHQSAPLSSSSLSTGPAPVNTVAPAKKKVWDLTKDDDDSVKDTTDSATKKKAEVGEAGIQTHGLVALSRYWDDKMRPMDGYVPLSIFNPIWLRQDLLRVKPKAKGDKEETRYSGLHVPDEWKMTFGEWVTAFDVFVSYLCYYDHGKLADMFLIHKANVLAIKAERLCWPMAFCYDQAVRTTVMTIRNEDGKLANPAVRDETLERNARLDSERMNDFQPRFCDINPYADFECKSNINPISGELLPGSVIQNGTIMNSHMNHSTHPGKPNTRSWAFANQSQPFTHHPAQYGSQPVYDGPGSSGYLHYEDRQGGGRNVRGRGRGGSWNNHSGGGRDDCYDSQRGDGGRSWRKDDRQEDRRGGNREVTGPKYGGGNKAKLVVVCLTIVAVVELGYSLPNDSLLPRKFVLTKNLNPTLPDIRGVDLIGDLKSGVQVRTQKLGGLTAGQMSVM
ncbi:uncharacterized protein MELLADRAFT_89328 [Melampsora larici-populina 98AG31]|uniref:Uncharacterized protein n=1 Tax=Melampsora larici-populina (strain 98AG31 / pathotype 3-4-7) TaxID=747676 RepID=F4R5R6_MELLP|nr:uncharacterized protein MELLADRAFT_89328 [Melampsora larici-populina 98AG31]EGG12211.1 hypothetical protein MELLADRAFT_89328 [Melampsora larici-populina 98AG31]